MRINYNVSAMLANNTLTNSNNALSKSIERLSSGLKINNAKDNPAGLAMGKRMNGQIVGTGVAKQNSNDGISVIETADGAMNEVHDMLHRMTELATKAATGTLSDDDREIIEKEIDQLKEEIQRIADSTQFNGQNLLDGNFDYKAYTDNNDIKVSSYGPAVQSGDYTITGLNWSVINAETGSLEAQLTVTGPKPSTNPVQDLNVSMMDNYITATGAGGFKMVFAVDEKLVFDNDGKAQAGSAADFNVSCTGIGPMRLQVGSNEGQVIPVEVPAISLGNLGITKLDVTSQEKAHDAIDRLKGATAFLSSVRGKLGAYQNRLESTTENLGVVEENMTAAYSRIMDVDMAEEMTNYSTYNVIVQAGTSVLAQANERPSQVLQLLQ
jgi:flagellin